MEAALDQLAEAMYKAPFVVLAHNKFEEGVDDPLFTYANRAALQLFEADWDGLVGLPSRLSADQSEQAVCGRPHAAAAAAVMHACIAAARQPCSYPAVWPACGRMPGTQPACAPLALPLASPLARPARTATS